MTRSTGRDTGRFAARRATIGVATALVGVGLLVAAPAASGEAAPSGAAVSRITITQTPGAPLSTCGSAAQSLSYTTFSDTSIFRLRVVAASPLCQPVTAVAAIYAMPTDGSQWPQRLAETKSFTISQAGTTDIVFTKDCSPSQFDVLTGDTPAVISPLGERHGPLLFPTSLDTAYQDPGIACTPTTTGATSTTSPNATTTVAGSTVTNTTTTTVDVRVAGATTTAPPSVLDTSASRPSSSGGSDPSTPSSLAVTGVSSQGMGVAGVSLLCAGMALLLTSRRRTAPAVRMITSHVSVDPNSPFSTK